MKNQNRTPLTAAILFAAITVASVLNLQSAFAATTRTWNGGASPDGNWTTPGNWNGIAPTTNSLLNFSGSTQTATTNNFLAGIPFNNINFNSGASSFTVNGNPMTLSSPTDAGSGQITGGSINNQSANAQTIRIPIALANGKHTISSSSGGTLKLNGAITRGNGAVVVMSGNINVTGGLNTNGSANGILGGWAIFNNNWATLDANSNVVAYSAYTDIAQNGVIANNPASNVRIPSTTVASTATTTAGDTKINSLFFGNGAASLGAETIAIGTGNRLVLGQNGGIFNSTAVGGTVRQLNIGANVGTGGILTAGDGINPATITFGSAPLPSQSTVLLVNSVITDNGPAPVTVVLAGAYVSMNGGGNTATTNTYSGGTYILQGRCSQPGSFTFGTGPIFVVSGGQFNTGCQITNDVYLEGSGTTENGGMGAVRIYSANLGGGVLGNLCGTVHLTGTAAVGGNNNLNNGGQLFNGISGKITGPGGLMINSPTATASGGGTVGIGSTNGVTIYTNDYAGDTTINGTAGGTVSSTLRIVLAADSNIMPHGSTGSFAGGPTGNLILNATAANRQAIFDLNGSTQTINGISSTATSPLNNIVADNGPGNGTLIIGDNNASSTFAGIVQSGVSITKIGSGNLTLSGPNTYTGDTVVKAGTLVTSTASTPGVSSTYSVSNSAILGITVSNLSQTLALGNLTLAAGSTLQLNAGTFGSPTVPIVNVGGTLTLNGVVNINLSGVGLTSGGPFPILKYTGSIGGGGSFNLVNSPRIVATLSNDVVDGIYFVNIASADSAVKWNGGVGGNWDINDAGNTIWQTVPSGNITDYIESGSGNDSVIFDDSATGTTSVNLTTALTPQTLTLANTTSTYTFSGTGKITGATGLTKNGTGALIVANSGNNDFSGPIALNAGSLVVSNDWFVNNPISGTGALVKNGPGTLTLNGDGSGFTGPATVNGGTLSVLLSSSLATASATTISSGGTLDIGLNTVALGPEPIIASGSGLGGSGAIVNSSGYGGPAVSTSFQNLTLAGNTTIGGPGRLDFRSTDANAGSDAVLNTGGQPFKLTKVSGSTLQISSVVFDAAFGDIDVQGGTLGLQGTMPTLGNSANTITVFSGATLQFLNMLNDINKVLKVNDGGTVYNNSGTTIYDGGVTLQGNSLFNIAGTSLTFTSIVGGSGTLNKVTGASPLILAAANTYSGGTVANAGLVTFSADNNLGALPGSPTPANIVLNGGGISASTDVTLSPNRGIAVGPTNGTGAGTIDVPSTMTYNGIIANSVGGVGGLTKNNGGTLFLGGANTYSGDTTIAQGTLALTGSGSINSSATIILGNSILDASARTDGTLTLTSGQTLTGVGTITGNLIGGPGSTVSPGTNLDASFTVNGTVTLHGTNIMNVDKDGGFYDQITGTSIAYGGTLVVLVSNTVAPLADGDAFPLYSASTYSGAFANIIPASPGSGLAWNTNTLATDGMLRITTGPSFPTTNASIASATLSGTNVLIHGTNNNVPNTSFHYAVLISTNIGLPLSNWTAVVTNPFNLDGTFDYTNPIVPGTPRQFIEVLAVP